MKSHRIEISEDVNRALIHRQEHIGESADSVLRRVLELSGARSQSAPQDQRRAPKAGGSALEGYLNSPDLLRHRNVTDRFIALLGWLGQRHAEDGFEEKLLSIQGRRRLYFARTEEEIRRSGNSTHPKRIPGLDLWAMTNSDTSKKCEIVRQLMTMLAYDSDAMEIAIEALQH